MFDKIKVAVAEIQQARSKFQINHFVIGQHATKEMQYYQTCIELQDMIFKYETVKLEVEILKIKIDNLRTKNDKISLLKAQKKELSLEQTQIIMVGHERELSCLIETWESFEHKYTRAEIEDSQADYWKARLTANAEAMVLGQGTVNPAHIEAMAQAGALDEYLEQKRINGEIRNLES
jgi:hypothetical protein